MTLPKTFLVAGGTGRQGGAVVHALLHDPKSAVKPEQIFVITRDLGGPAAVKLAATGINLVPGTLGKPDLIFQHLKQLDIRLGDTGVFLAQAHGPTELEDARLFIDAAVAVGCRHFVYSSVDRGGKELSDKDPSYCKTFSDKYHIEKHLIAATTKTTTDYTILRPTWFAENAIWGFPGKLCMTGWRDVMGGKRLQVVVAKDLGRWAAEAMLRADQSGLRNEAVSITSDELTFQEVDDVFRQEMGQSVAVTYGWLARFMIWAVKDLHTMFGFINEREYGANLVALSKFVEPTTFRQWVRGIARREGTMLN